MPNSEIWQQNKVSHLLQKPQSSNIEFYDKNKKTLINYWEEIEP